MANLPFIVKLFSSCFTMNEDPLCPLRNARLHDRSRAACTDSFSSFTDSESVILPGTSTGTSTGSNIGTSSGTGTSTGTMSCEDEVDSKRESKGSSKFLVDSKGRRRLHETDIISNQRKRLREDLSYLLNTFSVTDQEASNFANLAARGGEEPRSKKLHVSLPPSNDLSVSGHLVKRVGLNRVETFLSAKTKATLALFRRELNYVKTQLNISQARCELLQDENRWLRANMPDEEDRLLQYEVEMLLANKSQLALDNAYLIREREGLLQLVEYFHMGSPLADSD